MDINPSEITKILKEQITKTFVPPCLFMVT